MLIKAVTFFLIGITVLAMFGRLRWPGGARGLLGRREKGLPRPSTCPQCQTINVTGGPCPRCKEGRS